MDSDDVHVFNNLFRADSAGSRTRDHRQMHRTIRLERHELYSFRDSNRSRYFFVFLKNVLVFISFVKHHFYFCNIFVLKINIVFVFVFVCVNKVKVFPFS